MKELKHLKVIFNKGALGLKVVVVYICVFTSFFILWYAVNLIFFEGKNIYLILESSFILTLITTPILKVLKDMKNKG